MRLQHVETQHLARPIVEQLPDGDEVADALRHLVALDLEEAVVHPDVCHPAFAEGAAGLRQLILVMREHRSMPPPWISNCSPRFFHAIAEHSTCQPGRPAALMPAGDGHDGSPGFDGFPRTKSVASRLYGATSTRAPAIISSSERLASAP